MKSVLFGLPDLQALKHINKELINLYWNIGKYISPKLKSSEWGDAVVNELANYLLQAHPELKRL